MGRVILLFVPEPTLHLAGQQSAGILELVPVAEVDGYRVEFGRIGAIVADGQGRMYVADVHEIGQVISVLDPEGNRIGRIGGRGSGPGEFTHMFSTLAWMGDTLVAMDGYRGEKRIKFFDPSGRAVVTNTIGPEVDIAIRHPQFFTGGSDVFLLEFATPPFPSQIGDRSVPSLRPGSWREGGPIASASNW